MALHGDRKEAEELVGEGVELKKSVMVLRGVDGGRRGGRGQGEGGSLENDSSLFEMLFNKEVYTVIH